MPPNSTAGQDASYSSVATAVDKSPSGGTRPTHLVVFQHGLWGIHHDWDRVVNMLEPMLDESVMLHCTEVNNRWRSMGGVDNCAWRLSEEIEAIAESNPGLNRLSLVGLSMGGVVCRYVAAILLDEETGLMAGMEPSHYISVATPHLGISQHEGDINAAGMYSWDTMKHEMSMFEEFAFQLHKTVLKLPIWFTRPMLYLLGAVNLSVKQLFLMDNFENPLLLRMCDEKEENLPFIQALHSFSSRTAVANKVGDQWIRWENASLRSPEELPEIDESCGNPCVIRSFDHAGPPAPAMPPNGTEGQAEFDRTRRESAGNDGGADGGEADEGTTERIRWQLEQYVNKMLSVLKDIGWNRVDVSFMNASPGGARSSHDLIIQGEPVKNSDFFHEGSKSVEHLAGLIASLVMDGDCQQQPLARGEPTEAG